MHIEIYKVGVVDRFTGSDEPIFREEYFFTTMELAKKAQKTINNLLDLKDVDRFIPISIVLLNFQSDFS